MSNPFGDMRVVSIECNTPEQHRVVLRPNTSLSWAEMKAVLAFLSLIIFIIGASFARIGAWLVLPFSGLEVILLGIAFYLNGHYSYQYEIITLDQDWIEVIKGRRKCQPIRLSRSWAKIVLKPPWHHWHPSQLVIRSHGKEVVIGEFLIEEERKQLATTLQQMLS